MIELGLQRISALLAQTPLPWRAVHVAGTNGKGSVCAYISRMLDICNNSQWRKQQSFPIIRHGRFTSPHLIDRWDCISLNQRPVAFSLFDRVEQQVLERNRQQDIQASEFELLTATAFEIFTQEKLDIAVVEVGMGGRLDATNIIGQRATPAPADIDIDHSRPLPLASIITKIGLDHQAFLGDTLEAIAKEKSGIIKSNVPVFYDESNEKGVIEIIRGIARDKDSIANPSRSLDIQATANALSNTPKDQTDIPPHTLINISLALHATLSALTTFYNFPKHTKTSSPSPEATSPSIPPSLIQHMIRSSLTTAFPGRHQSLSISSLTGRKSLILLDGAHNSQSAEVLSQTILQLRHQKTKNTFPPLPQTTRTSQPITFVLAASDSKPATEIFFPLSFQPGDKIFLVEFSPVDGMPWIRPQTCDVLERAVREAVTAAERAAPAVEQRQNDPTAEEILIRKCGTDVQGALLAASEIAAEGPLVVAGSLYLVGDVLRLIRDGGGNWEISSVD